MLIFTTMFCLVSTCRPSLQLITLYRSQIHNEVRRINSSVATCFGLTEQQHSKSWTSACIVLPIFDTESVLSANSVTTRQSIGMHRQCVTNATHSLSCRAAPSVVRSSVATAIRTQTNWTQQENYASNKVVAPATPQADSCQRMCTPRRMLMST